VCVLWGIIEGTWSKREQIRLARPYAPQVKVLPYIDERFSGKEVVSNPKGLSWANVDRM
jgi:hypothetical protein